MPTTPTLPPERDIPDGASTVEFRAMTLGSTCLAGHAGLPQISIPAGTAAGCPVGLSFIGWEGGDEALLDLAVKLAPLIGEVPFMILAVLGVILIIAGVLIVVRKTARPGPRGVPAG